MRTSRFNQTFVPTVAFILLAAGCGGTTKNTPATPIVVAVTPLTATVEQGGTQAFTSAVTGSATTSVTWKVTETAGGGVTSAGVYTAPMKAGMYHVVAASTVNTASTGTATVTVPDVAVTIAPTSGNVSQGGTLAFTATVTGAANKSVTWSVQEAGGGSVDGAGHYTAPNTNGTYHLVATSVADATRNASVPITVVQGVAVGVTPATITLDQGATNDFTAQVTGSTNTAVTWTVQETAGGTVTSAGKYTAPATAGTYHVKATSVADTSMNGIATITVRAVAIQMTQTPSAALNQGATFQFLAGVTGTVTNGVVWSVDEGTTGGSITTGGLYTAPAASGTFHVTATADANSSVKTTFAVTVDAVDISVTPTTAMVLPNATQAFGSSVTGTTNTNVTWSVVEVGGGSINGSGLYTAPATPGTYTVKATSAADNTKIATAAVTVPSPVTISIAPKTATVGGGLTQQFTAAVGNTTNTSVTWTVSEAGGGSVSSTGLYTAPATPGTYHVVATSVDDSTKTDIATVTVTSAIGITISPKTVTLMKNAGQSFTAAVTGTSNTAVVWTVMEANGGLVNANGSYTTPATPGTYTVKAASASDPSRFDTATVTVKAVTVSISPATLDVVKGSVAPASFVATVDGAPSNVTWTLSGGGTIANGLVTSSAYATLGMYTVTATSTSDTTAKGTTTINIVNPVAVTLAPSTITLAPNGTQTFTATVTGSANTAITWTVLETAGGSIDASGVYTAPATPGNYHVVGTSQADPTKKAYAAITVPNGSDFIAINPDLPTAFVTTTSPSGNIKGLTATLTGTKNTSVVWSLQEGAAGGTLNYPTGTTVSYVAPAVPGTYHVIATGAQDATVVGSTTITVLPVKLYIKYSYNTITSLDVNKGGSAVSLTLSGDGNYSAKANWTLSDPAAGTLTGATNSASCSYTPGTTGGDYTLTATYTLDSTIKTVLNIHVADTGIKVLVTPMTATIAADQHLDLNAIVTGSTNPNVTWAVVGSGNGYISGGETYTAYLPPTSKTGTMQVTCASAADPGAKTTVNITVVAASVKVAVAPVAVSLPVGGTLAFHAGVTGNANTNVDWSVVEAGGGVIDATGLYTAPSTPGTYQVLATSKVDTTKTAAATVTVVAETVAEVNVKPAYASLPTNGKLTLRGSVNGIANGGLIWSVQEVTGGSVTSVGNQAVYTAPATPGTYHVVATSSADGTRSTTSTILVSDAAQANVFMQPSELTLLQGRSYPFMASVLNGAGNTGVSWNAMLSGGTFTNGLLTAGTTAGMYQVQATSLADSQASVLGSLNVISQPYLETFGFGRSTVNTHVGASAVTLLDGTVLVTGGSSVLNDSFDPKVNASQGSLTPVGNLAVNRYLHTATLLPNGKVLIAGGYMMVSPYGAVATVEIYDPATGSCTTALTSMPSSRAYHTATLLRDGRVLLVGGNDASYNDLASALLYNPADGTFTPTTGSLTAKRAFHTATLLMDGRVLIAGGTGNYSSLSTTEIFDPATGTFSAGPAMASARSGHTATLLGDGRIVFAFGGKATVEVMDVAAATSTLVGSAQGSITYHSATLMSDGRVALIGGQAGNAMAKWVHVFDPTLNALSLLPNGLVFGRGKHVSCLLADGRVLVVGGVGDNGNLFFAELMK